MKTPPMVGIDDDGVVSREIDPAASAKRRIFSAEQKRQILVEYEATTEPGAKGALLRREGIYSSHICEWRKARDSGSLAGLGGNLRSRRESGRSVNAQRIHVRRFTPTRRHASALFTPLAINAANS